MDSFWDFFWFIISFFFLMAYLVVLFQIVGDLFRDRSTSGWLKAVWIFFLILVPMITALVYLIVRGRSMTERSLAASARAEQRAEEYIRGVAGSGVSAVEQIAQARELRDSGAITPEEFEQLKARALS